MLILMKKNVFRSKINTFVLLVLTHDNSGISQHISLNEISF